MSTIISMERINSKTLLHARKSSGRWCSRAAALPPPRRRLIHGKHQQGLAGNDPLNTALVAQADERLRAQHAELALYHSLQDGRVGERIRCPRLLDEAVDGDLEVHVVCSRQQKGEVRASDRWFMAEARSRLRSRSAALSVRFCVYMQLRSAAQRAQRSAAQIEQKE